MLRIWKSFARPHLEEEDLSVHKKIESILYHALLDVTGVIELLQEKRFTRIWALTRFVIQTSKKRKLIVTDYRYSQRHFPAKPEFIRISSFHSTVVKWNKLEINLCNRNLSLFSKTNQFIIIVSIRYICFNGNIQTLLLLTYHFFIRIPDNCTPRLICFWYLAFG